MRWLVSLCFCLWYVACCMLLLFDTAVWFVLVLFVVIQWCYCVMFDVNVVWCVCAVRAVLSLRIAV